MFFLLETIIQTIIPTSDKSQIIAIIILGISVCQTIQNVGDIAKFTIFIINIAITSHNCFLKDAIVQHIQAIGAK